jgi:hypothetical protein
MRKNLAPSASRLYLAIASMLSRMLSRWGRLSARDWFTMKNRSAGRPSSFS